MNLITVHNGFVFTRTDKAKRSTCVVNGEHYRAVGQAVMALLADREEEVRIVDARITGIHERKENDND